MEATASDNSLAATEKTCGTCGRTRPIDEFRFRDQARGLRHTTCNTCFAGYHRGYRDTKRRRELKTYVDELATDPSNPRSFGALSRAEVVLRAMLKRFGGLERFADDWFSFIKVAMVAGKHHVVQRSFGHAAGAADGSPTCASPPVLSWDRSQFVRKPSLRRLTGLPDTVSNQATAGIGRTGPPDARCRPISRRSRSCSNDTAPSPSQEKQPRDTKTCTTS